MADLGVDFIHSSLLLSSMFSTFSESPFDAQLSSFAPLPFIPPPCLLSLSMYPTLSTNARQHEVSKRGTIELDHCNAIPVVVFDFRPRYI
ncbi:hypothetical protein BS17DRAFT_786837 [Gyrodon lividus]|nr:hypothetical protein BS17DRAFT_786837 [Gyrodon lividus]